MTTNSKPLPLQAFGIPPQQYDAQWYSSFFAQLTRRLGLLGGPYTIQPQLLLQSPNGTVYQITVSDTGTLTTAVATRSNVQPPI